MSSSIFDSGDFKRVQNYNPKIQHCAVEGDEATSGRNKKMIEGVISRVLTESEKEISDTNVDAYESFLSNVEIIDGEYSKLNYGNPFSGSINQMRQRLTAYKQVKKDQAFQKMLSDIENFKYDKKYSSQDIEVAEKNIEKFANELIDSYLPLSSDSQKIHFVEVAHKIRKIGLHFNSDKVVQIADNLELNVLKTNTIYQGLLSDKPITIKDLETVKKVAVLINDVIASFTPFFSQISAQKLLDRLYKVDNSMIGAGMTDERSPIAESIERLEAYLKIHPRERPLPKKEPVAESKKKNTNFDNLISKFQSMETKVPERSLPHKAVSISKKILSPEEKRETVTKKLLTTLKGLNNMKDREIFELISSLEENRQFFSPKDQKDIDVLIDALKILPDPSAYKPSSEELGLMKRWGQLLISYGITVDSYERAINPVQLEIKKDLIRIIQANTDSFGKLQGAIASALSLLEGRAITERLIRAEVTAKQKNSFSKQIAINIANTVRHLKDFKIDSMAYLEQKWNGVVKTYNERTSGRFSEILDHVDYCNLGKQMESMEAKLVDVFLKNFVEPELFKKATIQSTHEYEKNLNELKPKESKTYEAYLTKRYTSMHPHLKWISDHILFIKKVYNQGSDFNVNMGTGTCERNSEDRYKLLLRSPYIPSEKIELGSSGVGRFNQVTRNIISDISKKSPKEAVRLLQESYNRVGLNFKSRFSVPEKSGQDPHEALYLELSRLVMDKDETLFILGMDSSNGSSGHAINIQVDLTKPIYRFIDDNIGTVECPDSSTFKETLISWLKVSYPDLTSFDLSTFSTL